MFGPQARTAREEFVWIERACVCGGSLTPIAVPDGDEVAVAGIAEPLKSYVGVVASAWDAQKKSLAEQGRATFVDVFSTDDDAEYTASDSIHPNERGYELWASHIVSAIAAEA